MNSRPGGLDTTRPDDDHYARNAIAGVLRGSVPYHVSGSARCGRKRFQTTKPRIAGLSFF
jgi:hypothetical protein